jgi:hypothetical protein
MWSVLSEPKGENDMKNIRINVVIILFFAFFVWGNADCAENIKSKPVTSSSFKIQINKKLSSLKEMGFDAVKTIKVKFMSLDTENDRFGIECLDDSTKIGAMGCRKGLGLDMYPYKTLIKEPNNFAEGDIVEIYFAVTSENSSQLMPIGIKKASK